MPDTSVVLTAAMRSNLLVLQKNGQRLDTSTQRLTTGLKINSALDGPSSFFAARSLKGRSSDLDSLKEQMGQAISTVKAADKGVASVQSLLEQARGLTTAALSALGDDPASVATRSKLSDSFNELIKQIDGVTSDSDYHGKNLIAGNGERIDTTSESRLAVGNLAGISSGRVTNAKSADSYAIRIEGTNAIIGAAGDISDAERERGLVGLSVSGSLSTNRGNLDDLEIEVGGAPGRMRSVTVSDGTEARTINCFDDTQAMSTTDRTVAKSGVPQVSEVAIKGTIEAGDVFSISVEGQTFEYKATDADVAFGQNAADNIATRLVASIGAALGAGGRLSASTCDLAGVTTSGNTVVFTGKTVANTPRDVTIAAKATNAAERKVSLSFASGAVVSFTLSRDGMDRAANAGRGVSRIEKLVDRRIEVSNLTGAKLVRDGMSSRGDAKLIDGENSFAFGTGTVRLSVDENTIAGGGDGLPKQIAGGLGTSNVTYTAPRTAGTYRVSGTTSGNDTALLQFNDAGGDFAKNIMEFTGSTPSFSFNRHVDNSSGAFSDFEVNAGATSLTALTIEFVPDDPSQGAATASMLTTTRVSSPNTSNDLTVTFNGEGSSNYTIQARNLTSSGLGLGLDQAQNQWLDRADIERAAASIDLAQAHARDVAQELSTGLSVVTAREDFTKEFSDVLSEGALKLTQADQNEEGATTLMLQVRQQLGTTALSIANQSQQAILKLF
jgi:flagellin